MISLIVFLLMTGATLVLGGGLLWGIAGNMRQGDAVRRRLAQRLDALRLGRAVRLFGIDSHVYLHGQRIVDIEAQMRNCSHCNQLERCDNSLETGTAGGFAEFCPNEAALRRLRATALADRLLRNQG